MAYFQKKAPGQTANEMRVVHSPLEICGGSTFKCLGYSNITMIGQPRALFPNAQPPPVAQCLRFRYRFVRSGFLFFALRFSINPLKANVEPWFVFQLKIDHTQMEMANKKLNLLIFSLGCMKVFSGYANDVDWIKATDHAAWGARDSAGEVVYNNKMWILGGWNDSFTPGPRDVWNSHNGIDWDQVTSTANWTHGDLSTTLVFQNKIWNFGGWHGGRLPDASPSNQIWSSTDGVHWDCVSRKAGWTPRMGAAGVVFKNRMWLLGGTGKYFDGKKRALKNDVWFSEDGATWKCARKYASWKPRAFHSALVFDNKIWIMGGGNYLPKYEAKNDVWNSDDGVHWKRITKAANWPPRIWFSAVEYDQRMWILGGWSNRPLKNWNDVWSSYDGVNWTKYSTPSIWSERHEQSCLVYDHKIWVMGGNSYPLTNDVWYLEISPDTSETK